PIAQAIMHYELKDEVYQVGDVSEIAGKGLKGTVNNKTVLAGNRALMDQYKIEIPIETNTIVESVVMVAIDSHFTGYVTIADELKDGVKEAITQIRRAGIHKIVMLSGDKASITEKIGKELGLNNAKGGLLPEDKL